MPDDTEQPSGSPPQLTGGLKLMAVALVVTHLMLARSPALMVVRSALSCTVGGAAETLTVTAAFACPLAPCATRSKALAPFTVVLAEQLGGCVPTPFAIVTCSAF